MVEGEGGIQAFGELVLMQKRRGFRLPASWGKRIALFMADVGFRLRKGAAWSRMLPNFAALLRMLIYVINL